MPLNDWISYCILVWNEMVEKMEKIFNQTQMGKKKILKNWGQIFFPILHIMGADNMLSKVKLGFEVWFDKKKI